ncbi:MAG: aspartate aminotransferase [Firmicutes bacterium]|nr:aspartate aminotransferase [Bacillota bacterium]
MLSLSERLNNVDANVGAEFRSQMESFKRSGRPVIALNIGEPDFKTPEHISQAAINAIEAGFTKYTSVEGIYDLRVAICDKLKNENQIEYSPDDIVVSTGAKQALANALLAICGKGDEVIIPIPCWGSYPEMVKLVQATPVFVDVEENGNFVLAADKIREAITDNTKALLLTNPHNPTGMVYDETLLLEIGRLAIEYDFYIIADEIYEYLTYEKNCVSIASISAAIKARTITINGLSKSYAMTGWRVGYAAGPKAVINGMRLIQSYTTSNMNSISQKAALAALLGPKNSITQMAQEFDRRRRYVLQRINAMSGLSCVKPQGAFYIMINVSQYFGKSYQDFFIRNSTDFVMFILDQANVLLTPGEVFQAPNYVRLSYSNSMVNLERAMDKLDNALELLR